MNYIVLLIKSASLQEAFKDIRGNLLAQHVVAILWHSKYKPAKIGLKGLK
jgi:hypothetical protein